MFFLYYTYISCIDASCKNFAIKKGFVAGYHEPFIFSFCWLLRILTQQSQKL